MSVCRDSGRGTWYVQCWYRDWKGERRKKTKRGFATERDAHVWEKDFLASHSGEPTMTFAKFCEIYEADMRPRLKRNTWETKANIINTKILPYFEGKAVNEITSGDVLAWENAMLDARTSTGVPLSQTYLHTVCNQLSAIFNHAVKIYGLRENPMTKVGKVGSKRGAEMQYWTKAEYLRFSDAMMDKPQSFAAFEILYWTGIREGELLALTPADFDVENNRLSITKSYQRIGGDDVITDPKTPKSIRTVDIPMFLSEEVLEYVRNANIGDGQRIFDISKSGLYHEMARGCKQTGVKRIRIHDLRHSHVSLLIDMGYSVLAIADRLGHESIDVTYRYAHLFPEKKTDIAAKLETEGGGRR